jgi:hypothetical protein
MSTGFSVPWSAIGSFVLGGGGTAFLVKLWDHRRRKRAQSDSVALDLVQAQAKRIDDLEAQHGACQLEIAALHQRYSDMHADLEALLLAIELAPEKAAEAVAKIRGKGKLKLASAREAGQIAQSSDHVREHVNAPLATAKAVRTATIPKD